MTKQDPATKEKKYVSKKCPECYEYIALEARACPSCKVRVGKVDQHGMAQQLTNWRAYIICIALWLFLAFYVKWAFF
ncbi:MAG: hypothetical protein C4519_01135 [Desulfobacteraceae bacterium]|nr:MAG: hypothetical protein C4519_01135 [Desulfobacteraceae bacterium]